MGIACVFLDRDGVLNLDTGYTYKTTDLKLVPGVVSGLRKLHAAGFSFIVVTNQGGVAKGLYTLENVDQFHRALQKEISAQASEIKFLDFMVCPHHLEGTIAELTVNCDCRKPGIKLVTEAVKRHDVAIDKSWFIGDKVSDIDCGLRAGLRSIQVTQGGKQYPHHHAPFAKVNTLNEAADVILSTP